MMIRNKSYPLSRKSLWVHGKKILINIIYIINLRLTYRRAWCGCMRSSNRHRREGWSVVKTENALVHGPRDGQGYILLGRFLLYLTFFTLSNRLSLWSASVQMCLYTMYTHKLYYIIIISSSSINIMRIKSVRKNHRHGTLYKGVARAFIILYYPIV